MSDFQRGVVYSLNGVAFHYDGEWTLRGINLTIGLREVLGIIGPNGSGKTTLLKILARLLHPFEGEVLFKDRTLSSIQTALLAQQVAFIPQEHQIVFPYTALEIVLMGRYPHMRGWAFESKKDHRIALAAMERMEVDGLADRLFSELSGGEKQRVIIARALAQEPKVLLLDEPATFLDLHHQMGIYAILEELNRRQEMTLIMVSHDLNMASQFCHRLLLLNQGRMVRTGSPEEILTVDQIRATYRCEVIVDKHPVTRKPRVTPLQQVHRDTPRG